MKPVTKLLNKKDQNFVNEIRAFIYQQLNDLEYLMPNGTSVSIIVEGKARRGKKIKKESHKKVVIQLETSVGNLLAEGSNKDIYKAIQNAKETLRSQLSTLQNFLVTTEDRDQLVDNIMSNRYLH